MFEYEWWSLALAIAAGVACGFLNTVASSGSAVSLPVLMAIGLDPITANATNRVPLLLGSISARWKFHTKKAMPWGLAIKVSIPTSMSMGLFIYYAEINWTMAALTGAGSIVGGVLGANFTMSPNAKRYIFLLLAGTIFAEVIHLGVHYVFKTH